MLCQHCLFRSFSPPVAEVIACGLDEITVCCRLKNLKNHPNVTGSNFPFACFCSVTAFTRQLLVLITNSQSQKCPLWCSVSKSHPGSCHHSCRSAGHGRGHRHGHRGGHCDCGRFGGDRISALTASLKGKRCHPCKANGCKCSDELHGARMRGQENQGQNSF